MSTVNKPVPAIHTDNAHLDAKTIAKNILESLGEFEGAAYAHGLAHGANRPNGPWDEVASLLDAPNKLEQPLDGATEDGIARARGFLGPHATDVAARLLATMVTFNDRKYPQEVQERAGHAIAQAALATQRSEEAEATPEPLGGANYQNTVIAAVLGTENHQPGFADDLQTPANVALGSLLGDLELVAQSLVNSHDTEAAYFALRRAIERGKVAMDLEVEHLVRTKGEG